VESPLNEAKRKKPWYRGSLLDEDEKKKRCPVSEEGGRSGRKKKGSGGCRSAHKRAIVSKIKIQQWQKETPFVLKGKRKRLGGLRRKQLPPERK